MDKLAEVSKKCLRILTTLFIDSTRRANKADLPAMAGSLAFTTVLSIAPLIAIFFYVFKIFGGLNYAYEKLMPFLLEILSEGTGEVVGVHLKTFVEHVHARAVGWAGFAGLAVTAVTTYLTVVACFNRIWEVDKPQNFQHRVVRALTLMTVGPLLLTASIVITTAVATQVKVIPYSGQLLAFTLTVLLFSLTYALVPMVKVPLRIILMGSLMPAILLELAKFGYAAYTSKMVSYSAFYGSFAAIPMFLLWIYIAWFITLYGGVWVCTLQNYVDLSDTPSRTSP